MKRSPGLLILPIALYTSLLSGQSTSTATLPVEIGLGVDTTTPPAPTLLELWRRYLQSGPYDSHATTLWSAAEQRRWPSGFDLTVPWCYGSREDYANSQAIVLDIAPAKWGDTTSYAIRTLFVYRDSTMAKPLPYALCRVYATREGGGWVLANSLHQLTREWHRTTYAPITFVYPPTHRFDAARARRSVRFVDSVATAFRVRTPRSLELYIADSQEGMFRLLGVDVLPNHTPGLAYTAHGLLFSGSPIYGEWYPHEFAHMVLDSLTKAWHTPFALDEGLAMWLGGSRGRDFPTLMRDLAAALKARPSLTLDTLLGSPSPTDTLSYPAAAALLQLAYERGKMAQVKALLSGRRPGETTDTVLDIAERTFDEPRERLAAAWRSRILQYEQTQPHPGKGG
jgi:hypothetical protein